MYHSLHITRGKKLFNFHPTYLLFPSSDMPRVCIRKFIEYIFPFISRVIHDACSKIFLYLSNSFEDVKVLSSLSKNTNFITSRGVLIHFRNLVQTNFSFESQT